MTAKPITREAFEALREEFLDALDGIRDYELHGTARGIAAGVFDELETFLFKEEVEKEARRQQWLELCKEFGNNQGESK